MSKWEKSTEETANCNFTRFKVQYQNQKRLQVLFYQYSIVHSVFPILSYCECGTCQVGASVCACTSTSHPCSTTLHLIPETEPFTEPRAKLVSSQQGPAILLSLPHKMLGLQAWAHPTFTWVLGLELRLFYLHTKYS